MKKKILATFLMVVLAVSTMNLSAMAETATPSISLEQVETENGGDVSVKVVIENNPGIWGMDLRISYDKTALTLVSVSNGDFYRESEWTKGNLNADTYILSYEASGFDNVVTKSGTLAILNFKVSDTAPAGVYDVNASYRTGDIINVGFDEIDFNIISGKVTVKAKPVSVIGISLNKENLTLNTGESETLTATVTPDNATNKAVIWTSNEPSVAIVDDNGKVTAVKKGTATITATTVDGGFNATCTASVACSHTNTTVHPAKASTCLEQGNAEYTTCNDCGVIVSGSDAKLPLAAHNYIENTDVKYLKSSATCNSKAVYYKSCSVCGAKGTQTFEDGGFDSNNHAGETYIKDQKEATCFEEGYTGDTYCRNCDIKLASGTAIKKNAHNPASVWTTDNEYHWKVCQTVGCGNIIDKAVHTGGIATCTKKAVCEVCSVEYGTINADNHVNREKRNVIEAACTTDGYSGDIYCKDCDVKIEDGKSVPAGHKLTLVEAKEATHEMDGNIAYYVCQGCGKLFADANANATIALKDTVIAKGEHSYGDSYKSDANNHWKECGCGNVIEKAAHNFGEWKVTKEATANTKGSKERACTICGYKAVEETVAIAGNAEKTSPTTGDTTNTYMWIVIALLSVISMFSIVVSKKRIR